MNARDYIRQVKEKVETEVPKAIRKADKKALPEMIAPLDTPLGQVEIVARRAEQMAIAMTGKQVADLEDKAERFRELHELLHQLQMRMRDLEAMKDRYEQAMRSAVAVLSALKSMADELNIPLRERINNRLK